MTSSLLSEGPRPHHKGLLPISAILSFLYCPRLAYITQVYRPRLRASKAQLRGLVLHKVIGRIHIFEGDLLGLSPSYWNFRELEAIYIAEGMRFARLVLDAHRKDLKNLGIGIDGLMEEVLFILKGRFERFFWRIKVLSDKKGLEGEEVPFFFPERRYQVYLRSWRLGIHGVVDLIEEGLPVELKTGSFRLDLPSVQLALYAMLIEETEGRPIERGFLEFLYGDRYRITISEELRKRSIKAKNSLEALLSESKGPPRPAICRKACPAKEICYREESSLI